MKKLLTAMLTIALSVVTALSLTACGKVTYKDLQIVELNAETEYFGIAFRKGSNVTRKVEVAIQELIGEKKLDPLASKYGVAGVSSYTPAAAEPAPAPAAEPQPTPDDTALPEITGEPVQSMETTPSEIDAEPAPEATDEPLPTIFSW